MPINVSDLAKKLDIAPEAVMLHAMDLDFEVPDDESIPDEIADQIRKIELGDEINQTEHEIQEQLDREIRDSQQKQTAGSHKKAARKKNTEKKEEPVRKEIEIKQADDGTIILPDEMTVRELAVKISKPIPIVLIKMKKNGIIANLKQDVDYETAAIIASELGVKVRKESSELSGEDLFRGSLETLLEGEDPELQQKRPCVVSVMGHVDHGKTSILDFIRKAKVVDDEAGGITQRIGAYQVNVKDTQMTFLDTPGHEAFTVMRARGARATDVAILVVAANEGVKPQTIEAINHAKSAEIPIVVAINKSDLPDANPDLAKKGLAENDLNPEDWGGDVPCISVSAKTGKGIDELIETVHMVSELRELKANPGRTAICTVLEASMDQKSGISATVLVNTGTLKKSDSFVIYDQNGRVRSMKNYLGEEVKTAGPSVPVQISGLSKLPQMGDLLQVMKSEKVARKKAEEVAGLVHTDKLDKHMKPSLATLKAKIAEGRMKQLKIVAKADANGTLEAVVSELLKIKTDESMVKVIHSGVGEVTESDVMLASAGKCFVVGFNVKTPGRVQKIADKEGVEVFNYDVIYHLTEKIQDILDGKEADDVTEEIIGQFSVKAVFAANKKMAVVGGSMDEGFVRGKVRFRQFRMGEVDGEKQEVLIGEGKVDSVQIGQKIEKEVGAGTECGMKLDHKELEFLEKDHLEFFIPKK